MELVTIVVIIALIQFNVFGFMVGKARGKFGVKAPAMAGNPDFERVARVQGNTLEQLMVFVPAIYGFAYYVHHLWAMGLGIAFIVGRAMFCMGYAKEASKRTPGFIISWLSNQALLIGALVGVILKMLK